MKQSNKKDILYALLATGMAQAVYMATLAPTVTSEDSGEFVAAAFCGGVPHPPGFPVWCMLARIFCQLPFSNPAWRCNFLSAVFGSLSVGLLYLICRQLKAHRVAAFAACLCMAFSRHFWSQAIIAEVYTLNMFFFCLSLLVLLIWSDTRENNLLYIFAVIFGLSLGNHYMLMLLVAPPIFTYIFWVDRALLKNTKVIIGCALIITLCQLTYFYLYAAANSNPPMNWGDPSNIQRLMDHIRRTTYKTVEQGDAPVTFSIKILFTFDFMRLLWHQFTPYILMLAAVPGFFLAVKKNRSGTRHMDSPQRYMLLAIFIFNVLPLILILNYRFESEFRTRFEEYYLPAYCITAIFAAVGMSHFLAIGSGRKALRISSILLCLIAPVLPLASHWKSNNMSNYYLAYDYNRAILQSLEKDAVYFQSGDYNAFPCSYLQIVEGMRPDIILADTTGRLSVAVREYVRKLNPDVDPDNKIEVQTEIINNGKRPVYFTSKSDVKELKKYALDSWGMVYRVRPRTADPIDRPKGFFESGPLRNISQWTAIDDMGESIISNYYLMYAESLMVQGKKDEAIKNYHLAAKNAGFSKEGLNNIGSVCAERGLAKEAEDILRRASRFHPGYLTARRNLSRLLETQGRIEEALVVYRELAQFESDNESLKRKIAGLSGEIKASSAPRQTRDLDQMLKDFKAEIENGNASASLYNNLGNVYAEKGDTKKALAAYRKAIKLDPKYFKVYKNLAAFYRNVLHDEETAAVYERRYHVMQAEAQRSEKPQSTP